MKYKKILVFILSVILTSSIALAETLVDAASGVDFQIYLTGEGRLYGIGDNQQGELGQGSGAKLDYETLENITDNVALPIAGGSSQNRTITAGADFSVIIKTDGKAYATGENYFGQLGQGDLESRENFVDMQGDGVSNSNIVAVSAGADFVLLLNEAGEVLGAGDNGFGQIKDGGEELYNKLTTVYSNASNPAKAIATGSRHSIILLDNGQVITLGDNNFKQRNIDVIGEVAEIAAGSYHSIVRMKDGSVYGVGSNIDQQIIEHTSANTSQHKYCESMVKILDAGTVSADKIRTIAAGYDFSMIVKSDETVMGLGNKDKNQLGKEAKMKDGNIVEVETMNKIKNLSASWLHSVILGEEKDTPKAESKGEEFYGDVHPNDSIGGYDDKTVGMGAGHTLYVKDNILYGAGNNSYGQLGVATYSSSVRKIPFDVKSIGEIKTIATGAAHSVILGYDGSVWVTGYNYSGQLGLGDNKDRYEFTKLNYEFDSIPINIAAGGDVTLILTQKGTVYAMGDNSYNQLSENKNVVSYNVPTAIIEGQNITQISAGVRHIMALKSGGEIFALGAEKNLNGKTDIKRIASGAYHMMALKNDGKVYVAGKNINGQLGTGSTNNSVALAEISIPGARIKDIAAGYSHSLFLTDNGIYISGKINNESAQTTPISVSITNPKEIATGWLGNIIKTANSIITVGNNIYGQRGSHRGEESLKLAYDDEISDLSKKKIAAGEGFTLVLHSDGTLWGIGENSSGQLGTGENGDRSGFIRISTPIMDGDIADVYAGKDYSLILTREGEVYGAGNNPYGLFGSATNVFSKLNLSNVKKIFINSYDYDRIAILKNDGTLWVIGSVLLEGGYKNYNELTKVPIASIGEGEFVRNVIMSAREMGVVISDGDLDTPDIGFNLNDTSGSINSINLANMGHANYIDNSGFDVKLVNDILYITNGSVSFETGAGGVAHMVTVEGSNEITNSSNANPIGTNFTEKIDKVVASETHIVVLTESGQIYSAGNNTNGLLGNVTLNGKGVTFSKVFVPTYIQSISATVGTVVTE